MKREKKYFVCLALFLSYLFITAGLFNNSKLVLDTDTNKLYQNISGRQIITDFANDKTTAKNKYKDHYYAILGAVKSQKDGEVILYADGTDLEKTIKCSSSQKEIKDKIKQISSDKKVVVYGKLEVGIAYGLSVSIDEIKQADNDVVSDTIFLYKDGKGYDTKDMELRTLYKENKDKIEYYIPQKWKGDSKKQIEFNIRDAGIGIVDGYLYRLGDINGNSDPESLFVFYFNNDNHVKLPYDFGKTEAIERAIIKNILDKDTIEKFPLKEVSTYYGADYVYYQDGFSPDDKNGYTTEFVFQKYGEQKGIIGFLYLYKNERNNIKDIYMVMRSLQYELQSK